MAAELIVRPVRRRERSSDAWHDQERIAMRLSELLRRADPERAIALSGDPVIGGIRVDSRAVRPGDLFVALRGLTVDGADYVGDALRRGAVAVFSERRLSIPPAVPQVVDPRGRRAVARIAAAFHGEPATRLRCIGVTGTNGKTTTTWIIRRLLEAHRLRTALVGTIGHEVGDAAPTESRTTPDAVELQALLARAVENGHEVAAMEVSSHALTQDRVTGVPFDAAVFTNLTRDHLDYHGTMEEYAAAKGRLFAGLRPGAVAVLNADDPVSERYAAATRARVVRYGLESADAEVTARDLTAATSGSFFRLVWPDGEIAIETPLVGRYNVANALAAAATARALGCSDEAIRTGLRDLPPVPGRLERIDAGQPFLVVVDYAHTPDALANVLRALREVARRRVLTLFGCGGDRDRGKRPEMARAAGEASDVVVVTSDNPRTEDPDRIIAEIVPGLPAGCDHRVVLDRREAIAEVLRMAEPDDVVLIAGKGHETYQILRDATIPFDDRRVARDVLQNEL
jgi:UDP-N-acetylmuramoyl-L-alanyl-D-glutamate--2,6-diaminopimelate ligase